MTAHKLSYGVTKPSDRKKKKKCEHHWMKYDGEYFTHHCKKCGDRKREINNPPGIKQAATVKRCGKCGRRMRSANHQCPMTKEK